MHNLDDLLVRPDRPQTCNANSLGAQFFNKALNNRQGHISIKQGQTDFAQRGIDISLRQRATLGKPVKNRL